VGLPEMEGEMVPLKSVKSGPMRGETTSAATRLTVVTMVSLPAVWLLVRLYRRWEPTGWVH